MSDSFTLDFTDPETHDHLKIHDRFPQAHFKPDPELQWLLAKIEHFQDYREAIAVDSDLILALEQLS